MGDARRRHEFEHAVEKADAGAQDRREHQLLAGDHRRLGHAERRLDLDHFDRQIARHLVAKQHADFVQQLAEALGRAPLVAHQRQLVLDQRMVDDMGAGHRGPPSGETRRP